MLLRSMTDLARKHHMSEARRPPVGEWPRRRSSRVASNGREWPGEATVAQAQRLVRSQV